jgi:hypothetical protein
MAKGQETWPDALTQAHDGNPHHPLLKAEGSFNHG